jgi:hypothetical protein
MAMAATSRNARQQSAAASIKEERAQDRAAAMREYEAEQLALRARTERLRALRLAREAEARQTKATPQPDARAAPDTTPLRAGGKRSKRS